MADTFFSPPLFAETTDTSSPPSGFQKIQAKPDGKMYVKNSVGVEVEIGGGQSSGGVPTFMTSNFVVAANTQTLFSEEIDCDNFEIQIDGILTEVQ